MNNPEVLIVHHSAVGGYTNQFWAINQHHKDKDFPVSSLGYYIGYHYVIDKEGNVTQTRRHDDRGAHTIGWNDKSIGVCLYGNFEYEHPTTKQLAALRKLRDSLGLPVDLHRNRQAARICPGKNFTIEILNSKPDSVDAEKEKMIAYYIKKYPSLKAWLLRILGRSLS